MKELLKEIRANCYSLTNEQNGIDINVYLSRELYENYLEDESVRQLYNASLLPGVVSPVIGMPDIHTGYGLPIGESWQLTMKMGLYQPGQWVWI